MSVIDQSARFRERHRTYGLAVPYHDVSPMLRAAHSVVAARRARSGTAT
jgi:hypothetical protein